MEVYFTFGTQLLHSMALVVKTIAFCGIQICIKKIKICIKKHFNIFLICLGLILDKYKIFHKFVLLTSCSLACILLAYWLFISAS